MRSQLPLLSFTTKRTIFLIFSLAQFCYAGGQELSHLTELFLRLSAQDNNQVWADSHIVNPPDMIEEISYWEKLPTQNTLLRRCFGHFKTFAWLVDKCLILELLKWKFPNGLYHKQRDINILQVHYKLLILCNSSIDEHVIFIYEAWSLVRQNYIFLPQTSVLVGSNEADCFLI